MADIVKVAAVQTDPKIAKNEENLNKILSYARTAAEKGARLIVFPECAVTGYVFSSREEALLFAESIPGVSTNKIAACCRELDVYAVVGLLEKDGDKCYNVAVLIGPGGLVGKYRKVHLPFLGVDRFIDAGDEPFRVYRTPVGNIGVHICYDCTFPESARIMTLLGADIIVLPTNFPAGRDKLMDYLVNTRSMENGIHYIAANRVGVERGVGFLGRSKIIRATGTTLAEASRDKKEIIYAEVSLAEARQKRIVIKPGEFEIDPINDRRPEMYGELTKRKA